MSESGFPAIFGTIEEELRARVRQQEATGRLGLAALVGAELRDLFGQTVEEVAGVLGVEYCGILELLSAGDRLLLRAGVGWDEGRVGKATVGMGLESEAGYTLLSKGPVVVEDLVEERRFDCAPLLREHGVTSGVSAAVRASGSPYGVLSAYTKERRAFTEEEILFLQEVADVLGVAIVREREECDTWSLLGERTRWAAETEQRFTILSEANARLSTSTDARTVLVTAARLAVPALADLCFLDVVEEESATVTRLAVVRELGETETLRELSDTRPLLPDAPHGVPKVLGTGRPELVPEANYEILQVVTGADGRTGPSANTGSYLCVPLRVGGRTLGVLGLVSFGSARHYGEEDVRLAEGLAHSAALALDNARHRKGEADLARELIDLARVERPATAVKSPDAPELTARQMEVLELLAEGKGVEEIRKNLYLSQATVRNHVRSLLRALGAHSQLEAVARARKLGLLSD